MKFVRMISKVGGQKSTRLGSSSSSFQQTHCIVVCPVDRGSRSPVLDLDDDKRSYGGYGYGGYGGYGRRGLSFGRRGGYGYDSDGPRRSAHDKDGETYGHENGPHQRTEFGEKNGPRGDDRDYGYNAGVRSYGYGRRH